MPSAAEASAETPTAGAAMNAPIAYPAPCTEVSLATHVAVVGAPDVCVPMGQGPLVVSLGQGGGAVVKLPDSPSRYDDDDPIAVFLGPNAQAKETSSLSPAERGAIAAKTRAKLYYELSRGWGEWTWVEAAGKLSGELDLGSESLTVGEPSASRTQKCESVPASTCGGHCDDDGDCLKLFSLCGCVESTCTIFGRCTPCGSLRSCEEAVFTRTIPKYKVSATFASADARALGRRAADSAYVLLTTRITGAWRRVFTKTEKNEDDGKMETVVEDDSGYVTRIAPTGVFLIDCKDDKCGRSAEQLAAINAQPWSTELPHTDGKVKVVCAAGKCKGTFVRAK